MKGRTTTSSTSLATKKAMATARKTRQSKLRGSAIGTEPLGEIEPLDIDLAAERRDGHRQQLLDAVKFALDGIVQGTPAIDIEQRILAGMSGRIEPVIILVL